MSELFVIRGRDAAIAEWIGRQLECPAFRPAATLGVARGDELIAGAALVAAHAGAGDALIASTSPYWCSRGVLAQLFEIPFGRLGWRRLGALVAADNVAAQALCDRLGFRREGLLRQALRNGKDGVVYGMLAHECAWWPPLWRGRVTRGFFQKKNPLFCGIEGVLHV